MGTDETFKLLLIDDDINFKRVVSYTLAEMGAEVIAAENGRQGLELFEAGQFDLVLTDVRMPVMDGLELLARVRELDAQVPVILITAHGDIEMAVEALHNGATDFIPKPFDRRVLKEKIDRALKLPRLERENQALKRELSGRFGFDGIIGSSAAMRRLVELMARVAQRDSTVLILGESGTGKELIARALHHGGPRKEGPFKAVNCAAIPAPLLESELFGHAKGAFTGADRAREGLFQQAHGGTVFLDEIGDMPLELQSKILRVLQERQIQPVGSNELIAVDVRIIAATHQDLEKLIADGRFRLDLYYRLNVVPLTIPPLRERLEDIPLLVKHFLKRFGEAHVAIEPKAMEKLMAHAWPGNVRELENAVERALALRGDDDRLSADDIVINAPPTPRLGELPAEGIVMEDLEKQLLKSALARAGNNQTRAAKLLGITRQQLIYRMQKYDIH